MRVNGFVVALGLCSVQVVVAAVCRPGSITLSSKSASVTEDSSSTISISPEASSTVSTEASSSTASISTDASTTISVSTTSAAETTSTTEAATSTTSAGPPPIPTFNVIASGGGPAANTRLSSSRRAPFVTFDYEAGDASDELFSIEPETGRLKTSNPDIYVCATFGENGQPAGTAYLVNCDQQTIDVAGDYFAYLNCELDQGKVTCTAPWRNCNRDNFEWMCYPDEAGSTMGKFFVFPQSTWGYAVAMARDVPSGYSEVEWNALVV
ncbi:hypothetical protein CEP54_008950 [Fusarium duplospermum]|uniref:AA1-like domain-containing protein n=1 Tax=Fusarium duplospermum TaxID=1325734 RepID=A0A428PT19_9HYPO|nr:hypothetical protein CEP54_008950 [Fusarium duplospermum]